MSKATCPVCGNEQIQSLSGWSCGEHGFGEPNYDVVYLAKFTTGELLSCDTASSSCIVPFKNQHLSVSRCKSYETCPRMFYFRYVKKVAPGEPGVAPLFGKLLHAVLEDLYQWVLNEEFSGELPESKLVEFYRGRWNKEGLTGIELYMEGLTILRGYLKKHPKIDHMDIMAVEYPFEITLGEFLFVGRIDRLDKVDNETVRVVDFKSNRMLYSNEELETDLQMSLYGIVVKEKWPWVKRVEYSFHMLRHDVAMETSRDTVQLSDAADYLVELGRKTESDKEYLPKLNTNCGYCDYKQHCTAYQSALAGKVEKLAFDKSDLESVALAREQAHMLAKALYKRKEELDSIIKAHLEHQDELDLSGVGLSYRLVHANQTEYPPVRTIELIHKYFKDSPESLAQDLIKISNTKLDIYLKRLEEEVSSSRAKILRAELGAVATVTPTTPRLFSSKKKKTAPKKDVMLNGSNKKMLPP